MDFYKFEDMDGITATVAMAKVEDAIARDMKAQKRKFVKTEFSRWVDGIYSLSNKSALRYGASIGRKLIKGVPLKKTEAYVRGSDLAKVVAYALNNEGHLSWVYLRETLREIGMDELADIRQIHPAESVSQRVKDGIQRMDYTSASISAQLISLARQIEPIESHRDSLLQEVDLKNTTIVNQSNSLTQRNQFIQELNASITRLKVGIENQKDEVKKENMTKMLERKTLFLLT
jgi:hypothetical protein